MKDSTNTTWTNGDDAHPPDVPIQYDETGDIIFQKKNIDNEDNNYCAKIFNTCQDKLTRFYHNNKRWMCLIIGVILLLLYLAYFGIAMHHGKLESEGSIRLLVCTILGISVLVYNLTGPIHQPVRIKLNNFFTGDQYAKSRRKIRWMLYLLSLIATVTVIITVVALDNPNRLTSLAGLAALIVICFVTSHSPGMVNWHPVYWGFTVQFYFAALILKTRWGFEAFNWLGDRVAEFLTHSDAGAQFVFGSDPVIMRDFDGSLIDVPAFQVHVFAFQIVSIVVFFSAIISITYYFGIMQAIIGVLGRFLSFCLGTTHAESINAAGNIFVSMIESPLMIRPFLGKMTSSELHAVITGGLATVAGSLFGVYISFGVPPQHLITASVMSAPAALAISKLTYPEIEVPVIKPSDYDKWDQPKERNVIEAVCNGAIVSGKIIVIAFVNVIAFLSLLKFTNATLTWFGDRVGKDNFTLEYLFSYLLYPVAMFMGTDLDDCRNVAELIGIKIFTNEIIAYSNLGILKANRQILRNHLLVATNTWHYDGDDIILTGSVNATLFKGVMSERSEVISTYALCGFANMDSMGILLGALIALAPNRKPTMARLMIRAMIAGNIACFTTACIAGMLYEDF